MVFGLGIDGQRQSFRRYNLYIYLGDHNRIQVVIDAHTKAFNGFVMYIYNTTRRSRARPPNSNANNNHLVLLCWSAARLKRYIKYIKYMYKQHIVRGLCNN